MPELPEVQTVVNTLRPLVLHQRIIRVTLHRQDIVTPADTPLATLVHGRVISQLYRRAKRIVFELDDGGRFYIHLGMTGRLSVEPHQAELQPHTHLCLDMISGQIRFRDPRRFGGIWWLGSATTQTDGIGPEPLTMRTAQLAARLSRTRRVIKTALLDQRVVAGLGNIYVDEALFAAQIHPLTVAQSLTPDQLRTLTLAIKRVLRRALRHRGSTLRDYRDANGNPGDFTRLHRVYDRRNSPCLVCGNPIDRIVLGGRSTHFCSHCQPQPTPSSH